MAANEICFLSVREMARMLRERELSAREVMEAHLAQIARVNPKVNAIVTLTADEAMRDAARADEEIVHSDDIRYFHGVPVVHKDLFDTAGVRTTYGSPIYADHVPGISSLTVRRLKEHGAISVGKSNTPEFGLGSQTFNSVFGATLNPWDLTKTCGGSSGGAAVALACGMVPIADGSDMGGSLRNPANFNGVVGLRPSPGRVPGPPGSWSALSVAGPMARSVDDVSLLLYCLAGSDKASPISISDETYDYGDQRPLRATEFPGVPVAFSADFGGLPMEPAIRRAIEATRPLFASFGCEMYDTAPNLEPAYEAFQTLRALNLAQLYGDLLDGHRDQLKDTAVWNIEKGLKLTGAEIARAENLRAEVFRRMNDFMLEYEFLILPVNQVGPFPVETPYPTEIDGVHMETYIDWMKSCFFITMTGHPAISVPCGFTPDGLPVGVQIVGRYRHEVELLHFAHTFEQAAALGNPRPPVAR